MTTTAMTNQMATMKGFRFGVEIETFGPGRAKVAAAIAAAIPGATTSYEGGSYETWLVRLSDGREWKCMRDASIPVNADGSYGGCEIVSPILTYADLDMVQVVVRAARAAGSKVDQTCGIHVHVGAENLGGNDVLKLVDLMYRRQDVLYTALNVFPNRQQFCAKFSSHRVNTLRRVKGQVRTSSHRATDIEVLNRAWYGFTNYRPTHYDGSRYVALNLHALFTKGTVEFRMFNSTLHAGKVKTYIQLSLAMVALAKVTGTVSTSVAPPTHKELKNLLKNLGLVGYEFATARTHLLAAFGGESGMNRVDISDAIDA